MKTTKTIKKEIAKAIQHCVELYREEQGFKENLGNTLHENLASNGIYAEDEDQFREMVRYAESLI